MPSPELRTSALFSTLRWIALVGILGSIATLEYIAGQAAGWGWRSVGIPLGIDTFAMGALLAPRSNRVDRLAALGLMEFTVIVSAVAGHHESTPDGSKPNLALGAILATSLVFALWRLDETIRRDRDHVDEVTAMHAALEAAQATIATLTGDLQAARAQARVTVPPPPVEKPKPEPKTPERSKGCPTRVAARQILLDLDPVAFETTSNAELGRIHGGSDNWWGQRRREVADELAKIGGQA